MEMSTGGLTALERRLADCVEAGEALSLVNVTADNNNLIRAEIIERLVRGESLPGESHPRILTTAGLQVLVSNEAAEPEDSDSRIKRFRKFMSGETDKTETAPGLVMEDVLDLSAVSTKVPIELTGCDLRGGLTVENADLRSLKLNNSKLAWFNAQDAKILGSFNATAVTCPGLFNIGNAWIDGDLNLNGSTLGNEETAQQGGQAVIASAAVIKGDFHFSQVTMQGQLHCIGIEILGSLISNNSTIENYGEPVVLAERAQVTGSVYFRTNGENTVFSAKGQINLLGATIGQDLIFRSSKIACQTGSALRLRHITVNGLAEFNGAEISSIDSYAVDLSDSHIGGRVLFEWDDTREKGERICILDGGLSLKRATLESELQFLGTIVTRPVELPDEDDGKFTAAILAHSASIGGNIDIGGIKTKSNTHYTPFYCDGDIDFTLATIRDKVLIRGVQIGRGAQLAPAIEARLNRSLLPSKIFEQQRVVPSNGPLEGRGNLHFDGAKLLGFEIRPSQIGDVAVLPSHIGGRISISDATVDLDFLISDTRLGDSIHSLYAQDTKFNGNVYLSQFHSSFPHVYENMKHSANRKVAFSGQVKLEAAEIGSDLQLTGLHIGCTVKGRALECKRAIVHQNVLLTSSENCNLDIEGEVSFLGADIYGSFLTILASERDKSRRLAKFHDKLDLRIRGVKGRFTLSDIACARGLDATGIKIGKDLEFLRRTRIYGSICFQNAVVNQDIILPTTSDCREREKSTRSLVQGLISPILAFNRLSQGWSDKAYLRYARCRLRVPPVRLNIELNGTETHNLKVSSQYSLKRLNLDLDGTTYRSILFAKRRWLWRVRSTGVFSGFNHGLRKLGVHFLILYLWDTLFKIRKVRDLGFWARRISRKPGPVGYLVWVYKQARPKFEYEPPSTRDAVALINTLPKGREKFSRQPYDQIIRCLRNAGHELTPRHIEYTLQENIRKELWPRAPFSFPRHPLRWFYLTLLKIVSKHGLYVDRTLKLSLVVILFGWWTFESADNLELMKEFDSATMSQIGRYQTEYLKEKRDQSRNIEDVEEIQYVTAAQYPPFSPAFYTVDLFLPLIDLYQERYWYPLQPSGPVKCKTAKGAVLGKDPVIVDCLNHRMAKWLSPNPQGSQARYFNALRLKLLDGYYWSFALTLNHLHIIRLILPFLGWVLVSIMIAIMASRFRTISTMSRGS